MDELACLLGFEAGEMDELFAFAMTVSVWISRWTIFRTPLLNMPGVDEGVGCPLR